MNRLTPRATIEHTAEGTLVRDTDRADVPLISALKSSGFRWSRRLEAWYLPRAWREETRRSRIQQLMALFEELELQQPDKPRRTAAEREADQRSAAASRAVRLEAAAERAQERSDQAQAAAEQLSDSIPLGQPILVGHHSQRRHERDLARINRHQQRALEEQAKANRLAARAKRARRTADPHHSIEQLSAKVHRIAADLRQFQRLAPSTSRDRQIEQLADDLEHAQQALVDAGGVQYSRETVSSDDLVRIRSTWYPVIRANAQSVSVPSNHSPANSTVSGRVPWSTVTDHRRREDLTAEEVLRFASQMSPAFPGLRERLLTLAGQLAEEGQS